MPALQMAREREVPVIFALSRQRMGKVGSSRFLSVSFLSVVVGLISFSCLPAKQLWR